MREVAGPFNGGDGAQVLKLKVHNGTKRDVHSIIIGETWGVPLGISPATPAPIADLNYYYYIPYR